ncbi:hypothetical protein TELCIR_17461 [Teladorsagia circumcincta]|uniref:Uncharacterized protein n=1 Tax=Teladorsagia circumcincta TaxID=45464 RepID=A0A2G9TSQ5_TELCI|nr:hypothetical protein TELCIR_17461 [Teladorsagia circumcincta]
MYPVNAAMHEGMEACGFQATLSVTNFTLGVTIRSPERNHNQSEIHVMFDSGAGIRVAEAHGVLSVMTLLPPDFNETFANYRGASYPDDDDDSWFGQAASAQQEFLRSISQSQPSTLQYVAGTVVWIR